MRRLEKRTVEPIVAEVLVLQVLKCRSTKNAFRLKFIELPEESTDIPKQLLVEYGCSLLVKMFVESNYLWNNASHDVGMGSWKRVRREFRLSRFIVRLRRRVINIVRV